MFSHHSKGDWYRANNALSLLGEASLAAQPEFAVAHETSRPFELHPLRGQVLGEMHARPFHPISAPARILLFAFMLDSQNVADECVALQEFCRSMGIEGPKEGAKHCKIAFAEAALRWEQHSEFSTYTFEMAGRDTLPFIRTADRLAALMRAMPQPGLLLTCLDLQVLDSPPDGGIAALFDPSSLAASEVYGNSATIATDFKPRADGFIRMLMISRSNAPEVTGAIAQRFLEVETYRTLALLGLPEAQRLSPSVRRAEDMLTDVAQRMSESQGPDANRDLLDTLMRSAAALEAETNASSFRFGATRAYDGIVSQRLMTLGEKPFERWPTITAFLSRRLAPAMRTCQMLEERQAKLAAKLARTADLLRTRVEVDIHEQNRDLLHSMSERAKTQLRLQQTVEGLSVVALSYYGVGLLGYVFKGAKDAGLPVDPSMASALSVPIVVAILIWMVGRIRRNHSGHV